MSAIGKSHEEEHGHHHHKETFITKYIFSQDHKMIAKQFLITGIFMAVLGMIMSALFRVQLANPGNCNSFLRYSHCICQVPEPYKTDIFAEELIGEEEKEIVGMRGAKPSEWTG